MNKCWCGNTEFEFYSEHYQRCPSCCTLISCEDFDENITEIQDECGDLYGSNYWKEQMVKMAGEDSLDGLVDCYLRERALYWLKTVLRYRLPGVKSMELGCGLGQFSYLMKAGGYQQTAMELSPEIVAFIHNNLNVQVIQGTSEQLDGSYDIIEAFDVIEHVTDPVEFIQQIGHHLSEGGLLCLQTPCYDETLSYAQMQTQKPRFEGLMVEDEHIFLFSRKAMTKLLNEMGFQYVQFEPAFFGDDYDMYVFASKQPLELHTEEEIAEALNSQPNGRLIKALLRLFEEKEQAQALIERHRRDADSRLQQVEQLEQWLQNSEADRQLRLERINNLEVRLQESEADRQLRLERINNLEVRLQESEADRAARLSIIQTLEARLEESEADRAARLVCIQELTDKIQQLGN